jgi:hypothetical protein
MNLELTEYGGIAQRFKDGAAESRRQIDLAARAVAKAEPHDVAGHIACLENVIVHDPHSSGAMRRGGNHHTVWMFEDLMRPSRLMTGTRK